MESGIQLIHIFCLLFITVSLAQPLPLLPHAPAQQVPIGGLEIMAAVGGIYALKKLRDKQ